MVGLLDYDPDAVRMQSLYAGLLGSMPALMAAGGAQTDPSMRGRLLMTGAQGFGQGQQGYTQNARANAVGAMQMQKLAEEANQRKQWNAMFGTPEGTAPGTTQPQGGMMQANAPGGVGLLATPAPMAMTGNARPGPTPEAAAKMGQSPMQAVPAALRPFVASMGPEKGSLFLANLQAKNLEQDRFVPENRKIGGQDIEGQRNRMTNEWKPLDPSQVKVAVNPNVTMPPMETAMQKEIGEFYGKTYGGIEKGAMNAQQQLQSVNQLDNLLDNVNTGKFAGTTLQLKKAALSAGLNLEAMGIKDDTAPAQAAQAISRQLALQLRNPEGGAGMPGALSNADRDFLESMVPGLETTPEGRKQLVEYYKRVTKRSSDMAKMARGYMRDNGGKFDGGFFDQWNDHLEKNPLFTEKDKPKAPAGGGATRMRFDAQGNMIP